jgi:hypothetical protein
MQIKQSPEVKRHKSERYQKAQDKARDRCAYNHAARDRFFLIGPVGTDRLRLQRDKGELCPRREFHAMKTIFTKKSAVHEGSAFSVTVLCPYFSAA